MDLNRGEPNQPAEQEWKLSRPSASRRFHQIGRKPLYDTQFDEVQPFHEPGLAPARLGSSWFHILPDGRRAYQMNFDRVYGFYEGLAAVFTGGISYHILPDGNPAYSHRFAWCGNFQYGLCTVRQFDGRYKHILRDGTNAYTQTYRYAGDFREGATVVLTDDGLHMHINERGVPLNEFKFLDLQPFHKGKAAARDEDGWFHIDRNGKALYENRFLSVEPFYNGMARVELRNGRLGIIDENGRLHSITRESKGPSLGHLSHDMVGYWKTWLLASAMQLGIFQSLPASTQQLSEQLGIDAEKIELVLEALRERDYVSLQKDGTWSALTEGLVDAGTDYSGMNAVINHWSKQMYQIWPVMSESIKTGVPAFILLHGTSFFEWLSARPQELADYQLAMEKYAEQDYQDITETVDFSHHRAIIDAGGGTGSLLRKILSSSPNSAGYLLERKEVTELPLSPAVVSNPYKVVKADIFEKWPVSADAIVMSKVLHDWDDSKATHILRRAKDALEKGGKIYVVEKPLSDHSSAGRLLSLHLFLANGGKERLMREYEKLFHLSGLKLERTHSLKSGFSVMVVAPDGD